MHLYGPCACLLQLDTLEELLKFQVLCSELKDMAKDVQKTTSWHLFCCFCKPGMSTLRPNWSRSFDQVKKDLNRCYFHVKIVPTKRGLENSRKILPLFTSKVYLKFTKGHKSGLRRAKKKDPSLGEKHGRFEVLFRANDSKTWGNKIKFEYLRFSQYFFEMVTKVNTRIWRVLSNSRCFLAIMAFVGGKFHGGVALFALTTLFSAILNMY